VISYGTANFKNLSVRNFFTAQLGRGWLFKV